MTVIALSSGCKHTLREQLALVAPSYQYREPATTTPSLGAFADEHGTIVANACFSPEVEGGVPQGGWDDITATYSSNSGAELAAGFKGAVDISAAATTSADVTVRFENIEIRGSGGVYFDPSSGCSDDLDAAGGQYQRDGVITQAAKAGAIFFESKDNATLGTSITLNPRLVDAGARLEHGSDGSLALRGTNLYIGHKLETIKVSRTKSTCTVRAGNGQGCGLGACSFFLDALGTDGTPYRWEGHLTCQSAALPINRDLKGRQWGGEVAGLGQGVSYNVVVQPTANVGEVEVAMSRYAATSFVAPPAR